MAGNDRGIPIDPERSLVARMATTTLSHPVEVAAFVEDGVSKGSDWRQKNRRRLLVKPGE